MEPTLEQAPKDNQHQSANKGTESAESGASMPPPPFQLFANNGETPPPPPTDNQSPNDVPDGVMGKMEQTLGDDFSEVKIHQNSQDALQMKALAFTQGNDVHFAPGQFNPGTQQGQELLGHELTHVSQQKAGKVAPTTEINGKAVNDDRSLEAEADAMGAKAAQMKSTGSGQQKGGGTANGPIQRQVALPDMLQGMGNAPGEEAPIQRQAELSELLSNNLQFPLSNPSHQTAMTVLSAVANILDDDITQENRDQILDTHGPYRPDYYQSQFGEGGEDYFSALWDFYNARWQSTSRGARNEALSRGYRKIQTFLLPRWGAELFPGRENQPIRNQYVTLVRSEITERISAIRLIRGRVVVAFSSQSTGNAEPERPAAERTATPERPAAPAAPEPERETAAPPAEAAPATAGPITGGTPLAEFLSENSSTVAAAQHTEAVALAAIANILDPRLSPSNRNLIIDVNGPFRPDRYRSELAGAGSLYSALWDFYNARWQSRTRAQRGQSMDAGYGKIRNLLLPRMGSRLFPGGENRVLRSRFTALSRSGISEQINAVRQVPGNVIVPFPGQAEDGTMPERPAPETTDTREDNSRSESTREAPTTASAPTAAPAAPIEGNNALATFLRENQASVAEGQQNEAVVLAALGNILDSRLTAANESEILDVTGPFRPDSYRAQLEGAPNYFTALWDFYNARWQSTSRGQRSEAVTRGRTKIQSLLLPRTGGRLFPGGENRALRTQFSTLSRANITDQITAVRQVRGSVVVRFPGQPEPVPGAVSTTSREAAPAPEPAPANIGPFEAYWNHLSAEGKTLMRLLLSTISTEQREGLGNEILLVLPAIASILDSGLSHQNRESIINRAGGHHPSSYQDSRISENSRGILWDLYKARWGAIEPAEEEGAAPTTSHAFRREMTTQATARLNQLIGSSVLRPLGRRISNRVRTLSQGRVRRRITALARNQHIVMVVDRNGRPLPLSVYEPSRDAESLRTSPYHRMFGRGGGGGSTFAREQIVNPDAEERTGAVSLEEMRAARSEIVLTEHAAEPMVWINREVVSLLGEHRKELFPQLIGGGRILIHRATVAHDLFEARNQVRTLSAEITRLSQSAEITRGIQRQIDRKTEDRDELQAQIPVLEGRLAQYDSLIRANAPGDRLRALAYFTEKRQQLIRRMQEDGGEADALNPDDVSLERTARMDRFLAGRINTRNRGRYQHFRDRDELRVMMYKLNQAVQILSQTEAVNGWDPLLREYPRTAYTGNLNYGSDRSRRTGIDLTPTGGGTLVDRPDGFANGGPAYRNGLVEDAVGNAITQADEARQAGSTNLQETVLTEDYRELATTILYTFQQLEGPPSSMNTWDSADLTAASGIAARGVLESMLFRFHESNPQEFRNLFGRFGVGVENGRRGPALTVRVPNDTTIGSHTITAGETIHGEQAIQYIINDPVLLVQFRRAGHSEGYQVHQLGGAMGSMRRALAGRAGQRSAADQRARRDTRPRWANILALVTDQTVREEAIFTITNSIHGFGSLGSTNTQIPEATDLSTPQGASTACTSIISWLTGRRSNRITKFRELRRARHQYAALQEGAAAGGEGETATEE